MGQSTRAASLGVRLTSLCAKGDAVAWDETTFMYESRFPKSPNNSSDFGNFFGARPDRATTAAGKSDYSQSVSRRARTELTVNGRSGWM